MPKNYFWDYSEKSRKSQNCVIVILTTRNNSHGQRLVNSNDMQIHATDNNNNDKNMQIYATNKTISQDLPLFGPQESGMNSL